MVSQLTQTGRRKRDLKSNHKKEILTNAKSMKKNLHKKKVVAKGKGKHPRVQGRMKVKERKNKGKSPERSFQRLVISQ